MQPILLVCLNGPLDSKHEAAILLIPALFIFPISSPSSDVEGELRSKVSGIDYK